MAKPELLIDESQGLVDGRALFRCKLDVGKSEELKDLVLGAPYTAKLILSPAPCRRGDNFPFGRAFTRPAAGLEILLENLDRRAVVALLLDFLFAQDHAPGLAFGLRGPLFEAPEPAIFVSSAATRAFNV